MPGGGSSKLTLKEKSRLGLGSKQKSIKDFQCTTPKLPLVIFGIFISFSAAFSEIQALPEHRAGSTSSKTQLEIILSNSQALPHLCAMPKIDLTRRGDLTKDKLCGKLSQTLGNTMEDYGFPQTKTQGTMKTPEPKPYQNFSKI